MAKAMPSQCFSASIYLFIFWQKQGLPGGSLGSPHLVQGVLPHVAPRQRLVVGEDDGVVLGVGLVAPLPDPAVVVGEGLVKPPGGHSKTGWPSGQAHQDKHIGLLGSLVPSWAWPPWQEEVAAAIVV